MINSATNKIIKTIDVGDFPDDLEYNPNNKRMYVSNGLSGDVSVISSSTNTVIKTIDVGTNPQDIEYNPNNKNMYVS